MALFSLQSSPPALCPPPPSSNRGFLFSQLKLRASSSSPLSPRSNKPQVVVTRELGKNAKLIQSLAKHKIRSLEVPLLKHTEGPDLSRLSKLLHGKNCS
ncbi:uroporphyrinogen-III synthase, chloroplastic [Asparagus officinalis]|uniref:uroporphyrinogen-III synthase, chloroplastic n=1 Tax=Asparagus officinalis TaxID=4686 RepID=UPI00098E304A|nr:uroporphyrinogen-III synthase, chloroplastic [Asparagus officinalis]